ncbi:hypothetical protein Tco_0818559 [Tanacetum coccineum]
MSGSRRPPPPPGRRRKSFPVSFSDQVPTFSSSHDLLDPHTHSPSLAPSPPSLRLLTHDSPATPPSSSPPSSSSSSSYHQQHHHSHHRLPPRVLAASRVRAFGVGCWDSWGASRVFGWLRIQTTKEKVDTSKALDARLVNTDSNGTGSRNQDTSSSLGNDVDANDADIKPVYDKEPMAEVQLTAENNVFATGQQHTKQPEFNNEGEVDQNAEQCHDIRPLPAKLTDN